MLTEYEQAKYYKFIKSYREHIFNYAMDCENDLTIAEEITVHVFVKMYNKKSLCMINEINSYKAQAYIAKKVVNLCRDYSKEKKKKWNIMKILNRIDLKMN